MIYPSIRIEGNIISQEILSKLEEGEYAGQSAKDFGFESRTKVKDEIAFAWATAKDYWRIFQRKIERLPETATATTETRNDWMKPLLEFLGYQTEISRAEVLHEKTYAISHRETRIGGFPIHIMGFRDDLDKKRAEGGPRMSPHGLLQEYLNISEHLYGLVSNGRFLRLLRDSGRLVKLSFAEFDLQRMMEDDLYADFAIMYRLLHRSRMPRSKDLEAESLIERYHQDSLDAGSRIRERLSVAVEQSIILLANGFLGHQANNALRKAIAGKTLTPETYYQQLLRLIYRFLFLMVTEERDLIFPDGNTSKRDMYYNYYSLHRLRKLSEKRRYEEGRFDDLWEGLKTTFRFYESTLYGGRIGILPLDGDLFGADALGEIADSRLKNDILLECLRYLGEFSDERGIPVRVNYGSLDVEEFGSVYEGLLEYDPALTQSSEGWSFQFIKGDKRSSSGSHYTPEELVQPLIKHSLDYVIEEKLKAAAAQDKEAARAAKRDALLAIKVCDVACGSGHILLSAARRIATVLAQVTTDEEQPSPTSFRTAIREVIRHCIYGVDKNPLAVELCKVALWLEAHNPGMPLTFLDHRIRCGDSIVGLARREEIDKGISTEAFKTLPVDDKLMASLLRKRNKEERDLRIEREIKLANATTLEARKAAPGIQASLEYQTEIVNELSTLALKSAELDMKPDDTVEDFRRKREFYSSMRGAEYWRLKNIADLQVAQFFTPRTAEKKDSLATDARYFEVVHNKRPSLGNHIYNATALFVEKRFFHWFLEFPEVFEQGGFDCILGNPPFLGGQKISGSFGLHYLNWCKYDYPGSGSSDMVAYFFRRAYELVKCNADFALIATNTISQGATREVGLDVIIQNGGSITFAVKSVRWPGVAALEVSLLSIHKGKWSGPYSLNNKRVNGISSMLDDVMDSSKPCVLLKNSNRSFMGSTVFGEGFYLDPRETENIVSSNPESKDVLYPVLNGEDITGRVDQTPSRYVIHFADWPLKRIGHDAWVSARETERREWLKNGYAPPNYQGKVASDYPRCLEIVEKRVKPQRLDQKIESAKKYWWRFHRLGKELTQLQETQKMVLVTAITAKYLSFFFQSTSIVFSNAIAVFAFSDYSNFAILQSNIHLEWAWKYASTLESRLRYTPSDVFEVFPFPELANDAVARRGELFYQKRKELMLKLEMGMTKTFNLYHNLKLTPAIVALDSKQSAEIAEQAYQDILRLRQLHKEMDEAVLAAYGWSDLDLEHGFHEVEYLPENDRVRYTMSERARKEVLRRLLKLNHQIHEQETKEAPAKAAGRKKPALPAKKEEIDVETLREYVTLLVARYAENAKRVYAVKILMLAQLCKAIDLQLHWGLKQFGPYPEDGEFEQLLEILQFHNLIEPEREYTQVEEKPIVLKGEAEEQIQKIETRFPLQSVRETVQQIVSDFDPKRYGSKDMELRATLIYLHKQNPSWRYLELVAGLKEVKGKKFGDNEIEKAIVELEEKGYIDKAVD